MNDFAELESELKKLRPMPPSADLVERVEQAMANSNIAADKIIRPHYFRVNWVGLGFGLCRRGCFSLVRASQHGSLLEGAGSGRAEFSCSGNKIDIFQRIYSQRRDPGGLQHPRRRPPLCRRIPGTAAASSLSDERNIAVAQSRHRRITPRFLSERGNRNDSNFGPMTNQIKI